VTDQNGTLETYVRSGSLPGAVALLARGEHVEVQAVGRLGLGDAPPMAGDSIYVSSCSWR